MKSIAGAVLWLYSIHAFAQTGSPHIVISQIYGGGGNQGATLTNDFIELLNRSNAPVDVNGWTVQYASASGTTWDRATLSGTIQPGQYYLLQAFRGSGGTVSLPTPDAASGVALSANSGKIALVRTATALAGSAPQSQDIVDLVGYGTANYSESRSAPELSNNTAGIRRGSGCTDTDDNAADFTVGTPSPRNSSSAFNLCGIGPASPVISENSVVNAASYAVGAVAPGEIVSIFGTGIGPTQLTTLELNNAGTHVTSTLAGTRVLFDGIPAPIIYCSLGQTSVVVPYGIAGRASATLEVEFEGRKSNQIVLPVAATAPGIFSSDSSGRGQGAILNQNYQANGAGRPAKKGEVVIVFATGAGQTNPPGEDGRVTGLPLPQLTQDVTARIGGVPSDVLYAGMAPSLVNGVLQVNLRVPDSLSSGGALPIEIVVGGRYSQSGITVQVEGVNPGGSSGAGTGPEIDQRLEELSTETTPSPLAEIPNDRIGIPQDWLSIVSWNIQVGGTSTSTGAERPPLVRSALEAMFSGTYQILAAQEISSTDNADFLRTLLPGGTVHWNASFIDTTDSMNNGFWYRPGVKVTDAFALFTTTSTTNGRFETIPAKSVHPPHVAHFEVGDFDFTLLSVHLTFEDGDTRESAREMAHILDYLDAYFSHPDHDPDVIICGDFNTPSALSGQTGTGGITLDRIFQNDPRFQSGERRFAVTVNQPTSRSSAAMGGVPRNNYDHCVLSADTLEEFIQARRVDTSLLTDHPDDPEQRLTSDHFPVVAFFRTRGPRVQLDGRRQIRVAAPLLHAGGPIAADSNLLDGRSD